MRIEAKNMKSCLNCCLADAFIIPDACQFDLDTIEVECWKHPKKNFAIMVGDECSHHEPCCNHSIKLKE